MTNSDGNNPSYSDNNGLEDSPRYPAGCEIALLCPILAHNGFPVRPNEVSLIASRLGTHLIAHRPLASILVAPNSPPDRPTHSCLAQCQPRLACRVIERCMPSIPYTVPHPRCGLGGDGEQSVDARIYDEQEGTGGLNKRKSKHRVNKKPAAPSRPQPGMASSHSPQGNGTRNSPMPLIPMSNSRHLHRSSHGVL